MMLAAKRTEVERDWARPGWTKPGTAPDIRPMPN
jgi:hypothetical protein